MDEPTTTTAVGICPACGKLIRVVDYTGRIGPHASALLSWLDCGGAGYRPRKPRP